jgi:hypothetical protein
MKKNWNLKNLKDPYPCGAGASWADVSTVVDASKRHPVFRFPRINRFF